MGFTVEQCQSYEKCIFLQRYQKSQNGLCKVLIHRYCKGNQMDNCKRKQHYLQYGQPPVDSMLPTGQILRAKIGKE